MHRMPNGVFSRVNPYVLRELVRVFVSCFDPAQLKPRRPTRGAQAGPIRGDESTEIGPQEGPVTGVSFLA